MLPYVEPIFFRTECIGTNFSESDISGAAFVETNVDCAVFDRAKVYGTSAGVLPRFYGHLT